MDIVNPVTLIDITIYVYSIKSSIQIRNISDWSYEDEDVFIFKMTSGQVRNWNYIFQKNLPKNSALQLRHADLASDSSLIEKKNDKFLTNVPLLTDRSSVYIQIRNLKIPSATKMFKMIIRKCGRLESFCQRRLRDFLSLRDKQMKSDTCRAKTLSSHGPFLFQQP